MAIFSKNRSQTKKNLTERDKGGVEENAGVKVEFSLTVQRPAEELFNFWKNPENLPKFMSHVKSVQRFADGQAQNKSHWVATTLGGLTIEWDAEIINEHENELISWQSLPGSEVDSAGSVRFRELEGGQGTEIKVNLKYDPPGGKATVLLTKLFRKDAASEIEDDLRHFKQIMETGEFATTDGPPPAPYDGTEPVSIH